MSAKKLLLIISLLSLTHVVNAQETNKQKFKKLEWLSGKWVRTNSGAGQFGYESWNKVSDLKLTGQGITLKGKDVVFTENLELTAKGNDIFYVVRVSGEKTPVYFKLTTITENGFICENTKHDFPKKITYNRSGDHLKAVISGDGKSVDYNFAREDKKL